MSVSTLIQRLKALENGNEEEKTARALLVKRGLSEATVAEAQELLDRLGEVSVWPTVDTVADKEAQLKAEDALWGWYLEWSAIVRAVVKQRKLLRILGFSGGRRSSSGDDPAADRASDPGSDDPVNLVVTPDPGESANDDEDDAQADIAVNG